MENQILAKYGRRYLLIGGIALTILSIMGYSFYMSDRMLAKYGPLIDAAMEIKLEATTAHLWFEEILAGDRSETIETVIGHIDQSIWYAHAMLDGGENTEGRYLPLADPQLDGKIATVITELERYKALTFKRYQELESSGPGSAIDQQYDLIFKDFNAYADQAETLLQSRIKSELHLYRELQSLLIFIVIVLSGVVLGVHVKFDRRHETDLADISREVEVRKAAEQKLRDLNNLKDEFISIASHELRSPLTVVRGYAELLMETPDLSPGNQAEYLQHILTKTTALNRVVDEFLDVSRLESGHPISVSKTPVKIAAIARAVLQQQSKRTDRHDFNLQLDDEQIEVKADPNRLYQVFENLIGNAIKYSPDGGRIDIWGERSADHYQVTVSDDGIGMSPEQQEQLFKKYYRANSANQAIKGLGIGLYFVKNLIDLHGGQIWVNSQPGKGSQFVFTLPLVENG